MMRYAHDQGTLDGVAPLLMTASGFRPAFNSLTELSALPKMVNIARGQELPELVCIPSFINQLGPHQFLRIANEFDGKRTVSAISLPGFRDQELLPGSLSLAVEAIAEGITETMADKPFVLVGYSGGGYLAYGATEALERNGAAPVGLVLLDSFILNSDESTQLFSVVMSQLLSRDGAGMLIDDNHLVAMGAYMRMFSKEMPVSIETPSLLIQANEYLSDGTRDGRWPVTDSTVQVDGNHFTIIEQHAGSTAGAIEKWLSTIAQPRVGA
jgi:thioesterase domain-containing protein